ncbi:MAG: cold shock and DUF1294 domain-containing protein [Halieaceae bacterium]|nr:cold shock and DUF1294 domain-containing protein [Halieaceae bacterium]
MTRVLWTLSAIRYGYIYRHLQGQMPWKEEDLPALAYGLPSPNSKLRFAAFGGSTMRGKGTLTTWNDEKGFGFIEPFDGGTRLFIHISAFSHRGLRPEKGKVVTYTISADEKGRPRAIEAMLAGVSVPKQRGKRDGVVLANTVAALFMMAVAVGTFSTEGPLVLLPYYVVASIVTFLAYYIDKSAAKRGGRRTAEQTLHVFSLIGGWPGALIARHRFRHKTRKQPFRTMFWLTVVGNVVGLLWLLSSQAASELRSTLGGML